jgi:hypothetical protein
MNQVSNCEVMFVSHKIVKFFLKKNCISTVTNIGKFTIQGFSVVSLINTLGKFGNGEVSTG